MSCNDAETKKYSWRSRNSRPAEFPRVAEGQPILGIFLLPTVADHLAEQAMVVADAIAAGRNAEAGHALHQTGRQAPQAAIAERRIGLGSAHPVEIDAEIAE